MGCQTSLVYPIIIPSGAKGDDGTPGAAGAAGVAIYINTITSGDLTSTGTGLQNLYSGTLAGNLVAAGDIINLEALVTTTTTFTGPISITLGGVTLASYTIEDLTSRPIVPPFTTGTYYRISAKLYVKTTATQSYLETVEVFGNPATIKIANLSTTTIDTTSSMAVAVTSNPAAGTVILKAFTLTISKKV